MSSIKQFLIWFFIFSLSLQALTTKGQNQVCSLEGIDLGLCLNQGNISFSIDATCCKVLNKVVRTGYNCLCLLIAQSFPLISTPISLPLSDCFISVPSLTLCKVVAPMPITFPQNSTNHPYQASLPAQDMPVSPPHDHIEFTVNSTANNSSTAPASPPREENSGNIAATQPQSDKITCPETPLFKQKNEKSKGGNKANSILLHQNLLVFLALFLCIVMT
ncbi:uncharacterized protein LOC126668948 [Mercurialis annua]|uniref:uncharacterized protein LOC126668948 n=1 Tax=Mercurialis annua TaxID=3986 RepID=UPI0021604F13|nr:uncharacterized protein LOC126668948 [Mercurialis annua]